MEESPGVAIEKAIALTGDHIASVCKEDQLDRGGRDIRYQLPAFTEDTREV